MQEHCKRAHGWRNNRGSRRPSKHQRDKHQVPWTAGIHCQCFFKSRLASGWFEVRAGRGTKAGGEPQIDEQRVERITAQQEQRFKQAHKTEIKEARQKDEPNL